MKPTVEYRIREAAGGVRWRCVDGVMEWAPIGSDAFMPCRTSGTVIAHARMVVDLVDHPTEAAS